MSATTSFYSVWTEGRVFRTRSAFVRLTSRASCVSVRAALVGKTATAVLPATSASWLCCSASSPTACLKPVPSALVLASVLNLGPKPQSRSVSLPLTEPCGQRRGSLQPLQPWAVLPVLRSSGPECVFRAASSIPDYSRLHTDEKLLAHLLASLNTWAEKSINYEPKWNLETAIYSNKRCVYIYRCIYNYCFFSFVCHSCSCELSLSSLRFRHCTYLGFLNSGVYYTSLLRPRLFTLLLKISL